MSGDHATDLAPSAPPEEAPPSRWQWLRDAFSLEPEYQPLTDDELALLERMADYVARRGLVVPALLLLESVKPLNYLGSQAMAFFEPMVRMLFAGDDYHKLRRILERRQSIEILMQRIERADERRLEPSRPVPEGDGDREDTC